MRKRDEYFNELINNDDECVVESEYPLVFCAHNFFCAMGEMASFRVKIPYGLLCLLSPDLYDFYNQDDCRKYWDALDNLNIKFSVIEGSTDSPTIWYLCGTNHINDKPVIVKFNC